MPSTDRAEQRANRNHALPERLLIAALLLSSVLLTAFMLRSAARTESAHDVYGLSNYIGPVVQSVVEHGSMDLVRNGPEYAGVVHTRAARMPFPIYLLVGLRLLCSNHFAWIQIGKSYLLLVPLWITGYLVIRKRAGSPLWLTSALMALPLLIPSFLLLIVSLQVEEAYFYSFLSLAFALVLYWPIAGIAEWLLCMLFVISADLVYLSKSSMRLVFVVLVIALVLRLQSPKLRVAVCLLAAAAPLGWALHLEVATGHFSMGTSLDGFNLHKGNYEEFLSLYPPEDNGYMDRWDYLLVPGGVRFASEWQENAYHTHAAWAFIKAEPGTFLRAAMRKGFVYYLSLRDVGSGHKRDIFARLDMLNMLLFRCLFLVSLATALYGLSHRELRFVSIVFLALFCAAGAPYIVGFALTRHAAILICPCCVFLAACSSQRFGGGTYRAA